MGDIDVVICSLLTHHLTDPQIVQFLQWTERTTRRGWFVNDLHRKPVPYHLFRLWAPFTNMASVRQERWGGVDPPQLRRGGLEASVRGRRTRCEGRLNQRISSCASVCWADQIGNSSQSIARVPASSLSLTRGSFMSFRRTVLALSVLLLIANFCGLGATASCRRPSGALQAHSDS